MTLSLVFGRARMTSSQSPSSNFCDKPSYEIVISESTDQQVILAKNGSNNNNPPTNRGPSNFPTPPTSPSRGRPTSPVYVPEYRTTPDIVNRNTGWGLADNPSGTGSESDSNDDFEELEDQCPVPNQEQSTETNTHDQDSIQEYKKKKKKRNEHLDKKVEVDGELYEFERDKIEKKTPSHGTDFGLEPDRGPDGEVIRDRKTGKPRAKQNKQNYEQFTENLSEFIQDPKSEKIEPTYRKGRENEQDVVGFRQERKFVIFNRETRKYITSWEMNDVQYQEFINNNNII